MNELKGQYNTAKDKYKSLWMSDLSKLKHKDFKDSTEKLVLLSAMNKKVKEYSEMDNTIWGKVKRAWFKNSYNAMITSRDSLIDSLGKISSKITLEHFDGTNNNNNFDRVMSMYAKNIVLKELGKKDIINDGNNRREMPVEDCNDRNKMISSPNNVKNIKNVDPTKKVSISGNTAGPKKV